MRVRAKAVQRKKYNVETLETLMKTQSRYTNTPPNLKIHQYQHNLSLSPSVSFTIPQPPPASFSSCALVLSSR
eukprot:m.219897 g.219897  ORF g.219897 m.219897 type:complete len:73 (-) comp26295_c1_seq13:822-1040(-)